MSSKRNAAPAPTSADVQTDAPAPEAPAPVTPAPVALTPAERKAARIAKRDAHRAAGGLWRNAAGNPDARDLPCLCGCGAATHRDVAFFLSGHDATLRAAVLRASEQTLDAVPEIARPFFREGGAPIAGLLLDVESGRLLDVKGGAA